MKTKPVRKFTIHPQDIEGPLGFDGAEDTFKLHFIEHGDNADKVVEVTFENCFEWNVAIILKKLFEKQQKYIDDRKSTINWAKDQIRSAVE